MATLATPQLLSDLWEELTAPSAIAFTRALARRGIRARVKDVEAFISSKSERQISAPGVKFTGKIVAHDQDDRRAADLINYTARPEPDERGVMQTQALIVQDLFTRFVWIKVLPSAKETTQAFKEILEESKRQPRRLDTDKGVEFTANRFRELCSKYEIDLVIEDPEDRNGTARMDTAIAQLKRATRRMQEIQGGAWLDHLEKVAIAYNETPATWSHRRSAK